LSNFILTREYALAKLHEFLDVLPRYQEERNFIDFSSNLSPFIRRRILTEEEIIKAVLKRYTFYQAEKFIQEVCWRTYWKGYLEARPAIWLSYLEDLEIALTSSKTLNDSSNRIQTGLGFFEEWVEILEQTNFLHNHIRMWFASVWIFTLKLPWQLGADFMYKRLIDADPASNTLSWRWVAGLQTRGKRYVVTPSNINKFSRGRWCPKSNELDIDPPVIPWIEIPPYIDYDQGISSTNCDGIITTVEDLSEGHTVYLPDSSTSFDRSSVDELSKSREIKILSSRNELIDWASNKKQVGVFSPNVGSQGEAVLKIIPNSRPIRKSWDKSFYPLAKRGFFPFWKYLKEGEILKRELWIRGEKTESL
jgi:FAD binding domain of DNA photolyase